MAALAYLLATWNLKGKIAKEYELTKLDNSFASELIGQTEMPNRNRRFFPWQNNSRPRRST